MSNVTLCEARFTRHLRSRISENETGKARWTEELNRREHFNRSGDSAADHYRVSVDKIKCEINQTHRRRRQWTFTATAVFITPRIPLVSPAPREPAAACLPTHRHILIPVFITPIWSCSCDHIRTPLGCQVFPLREAVSLEYSLIAIPSSQSVLKTMLLRAGEVALKSSTGHPTL